MSLNVNFPELFLKRSQRQFGLDYERFYGALNEEPVVSVRKNPAKPTNLWKNEEKVAWCTDGYYLSEKPAYIFDPFFHAGCFYPQEASSMFIDWILRHLEKIPQKPVVLDLCAAPGGKTTLLASYLNNEGLLVANEIIRNRSQILLENVIKWGYSNCVVTQNSPSDFLSLKNFFDLILVDAPCSGEGMFRKEKRAIEEWSEANAAMCAIRQRKILENIWGSLKPDGFLIYSTCTFNPSENEEIILNFANNFNAEVIKLNPPKFFGLFSIDIAGGNGLAFYPHLAKGEGFFVSVLRKTKDNNYDTNFKREKTATFLKSKSDFSHILNVFEDWIFIEEKNQIHAISQQFEGQLYKLKKQLNILNYGINIGNYEQKKYAPSQALATNTAFCNNDFFSEIDLDIDFALKYLKGEILPSLNVKKGYILLKYKGIPLGFGKEIGLRVNNLYPTKWRIRK